MVGVEGSLRDKFMLLAELGFDGIELDSPNDLDPDEVLRARDDSGLAIPGVVDSVHWKWTLGDPESLIHEDPEAAVHEFLDNLESF